MKPSQYKWTVVDDVMIAVGTGGKFPDDPWRACVHEMATKPIKKFIALIMGSSEVSSIQRKLGIDVINKRKIKVAIVNDSSVVRGIVTAASWFGVDAKSFPPTEMNEAVRELGIPEYREDAILMAIEKLKASLL